MTPCPRCAELVRENGALRKQMEAAEAYIDWTLYSGIMPIGGHYCEKEDTGRCYFCERTGFWGAIPETTRRDKGRDLHNVWSAMSWARRSAPAQPEAKPCCWCCKKTEGEHFGREKLCFESGPLCKFMYVPPAPPEAGKCPHGGELSPVSGMCAGDCSAGKSVGDMARCDYCNGTGEVEVDVSSPYQRMERCPMGCQPPDKEAK